MIFPRISLHCTLIPVQNRENENGLLGRVQFVVFEKQLVLIYPKLPQKNHVKKLTSYGILLTNFLKLSVMH